MTTVGSDEVGYGSWCGPLVVCATCLPSDFRDPDIKDSKSLSRKQREIIFERYSANKKHIVVVDSETIDQRGVFPSLLDGHSEAITAIEIGLLSDFTVVVDGTLKIKLGSSVRAYCVPKADTMVPAVALASIFAKVTRDRMMVEYAKQFPGYGFEKHMGYGTPQHQEALEKLGPCPIHRRSYAPVADVIARLNPEPNIMDLFD